jgi:hypothetical protein
VSSQNRARPFERGWAEDRSVGGPIGRKANFENRLGWNAVMADGRSCGMATSVRFINKLVGTLLISLIHCVKKSTDIHLNNYRSFLIRKTILPKTAFRSAGHHL